MYDYSKKTTLSLTLIKLFYFFVIHLQFNRKCELQKYRIK